jgi:perosamine synthetase
MAVIPRQIIYPFSYACDLFGSTSVSDEENCIAELQGYLAAKHAPVPLGRARMGLFLLVKYACAQKRSKVILASYTIPDVVNMVLLAGAEPVFVDVQPGTTNVDLNHLADLVDDDTACVIVTHYHVNQSGMKAIRSLCEERGALLFEDCAIAIGATIEGTHAGLYADAGVYSFSGYKVLNFLWGGLVVSASGKLSQAVRDEVAQWQPLPLRKYLGQLARIMRYDIATRPGVFETFTFPLIQFRQRGTATPVSLATTRIETEHIDESLRSRPNARAFRRWRKVLPLTHGYLLHRRAIAGVYDSKLKGLMVSADTSVDVARASCFVNYPIFVPKGRRDFV